MNITIARTLGIVLSVALLIGGCGSGKGTADPPTDNLAPKLTAVSPQEGALGTFVTLTGKDFADNPEDNIILFRAPAQGTLTIKPIAASRDEIRFIMPAAVAEKSHISVEVNKKHSSSMSFEVLAMTDPTPGEKASELTAFYGTLDHTLADLNGAMETALLPFMEANGQTAEAARIREGMAQIREGFGQSSNEKKATMSAADLAALDAFFASDAMQQVLQQLAEVSGKLNGQGTLSRVRAARALALDMGSINSGTLEDINDARNFLKNLREIMDDLNDALLAAEVAAGGASLIPGAQGAASIIPVLEEIRQTIVKPIIGVLDVVIAIIGAVPTDAVGGTLAVTVADNDLYMNQGFGSMQNPVPAELNPGHVLVLEPYAVTGTVDFHNDGKSLNQLADDLATEINPVIAGLLKLSGFKIEGIVLDEVKVRLKLVTDRPDIFSGSWGGSMLHIAAAQPGGANVTVRADLRQIVEAGEPCPIEEIGIGAGGTCIRAEDLEITRPMRAYAGQQNSGPYTQGGILHTAQVEGLPAGQAYIGDTLHITGEAFTTNPQLAHQDVYFGAAVADVEGSTGKAWSIHQDNNGYFDFDVEVPDALSGPMNVTVESHPSNSIDFTILPPHLDEPYPSAIAGEAWPPVTGRGFSHYLPHNEGDWSGGRAQPFAPAAAPYSLGNEAAHRELEFIVPDSAQSGPFKVITLGQLESNSYEVAARRFSEPIALSALDRAGLRPSVARDDSNGDRIVAWIDHNNDGANQLVAAILPANATAFSTPVVVSGDIGGLPGAPPRPAVAAAGGRFYVAWISAGTGNDEVMLASSVNGQTWSPAMNISNSNTTSSLQPAIGADGSLVTVAWIEEAASEGGDAALQFRISPDSGTSFGGAYTWPGGDTADPVVAVKGQTIAVAWSADFGESRDILVVRTNDGGATFNDGNPFTNGVWRAGTNSPGGLARHPSVAIGPSCVETGVNSVYVAWDNTGSGNMEEDIFIARWDSYTSTNPVNVSNTTAYSRTPAITIDADCTPALSWLEQGLPKATVLYNGVTNQNQPLPSALYFARSFDNGATFNTPYMKLLEKSDGSRLGHLAMTGTGQALLTMVYQDDSGGTPHIVLRTTEGEPGAPGAQPAAAAGEANVDLIYWGYNGGLYVTLTSPSGTRRQRIDNLYSLHTVGMSPDGRWIAFLPGVDRLIVAEADGAYPLFVAAAADFVLRGGAYWSPRGDYIGIACFWAECSPYEPIAGWVKPDSTGFKLSVQQAAIFGFTGLQPWSPTGIMASAAGGSFGTVDPAVNTAHTISVTLPDGKYGYFPAWSPDGSRIAFIASNDASVRWDQGRHGYGDLYVMNADGTGLRQVTNQNDAATPVWSPDGSRIVFASNLNNSVYLIEVDGLPGSEVNLAGGNPWVLEDSMPFFLPDGSAVGVWRRDTTAGTTHVEIINLTSLMSSPLTPTTGITGPGAAFHLGTRPAWAADASLTPSNIGMTVATITWPTASDNKGVTEYRVYQGDTLVAVVSGSDASYTVTNLIANTTYTLTVQACDAAGNCSLHGPATTVTTAADTSGDTTPPVWSMTPPMLTENQPPWYPIDPYEAWLQSTDAMDDGPVTYVLYRDGIEVLSSDWTLIWVTGLRPVTTYNFKVEACDLSGNCTTNGPSLAHTTGADTTPLTLSSATVRAASLTLQYDDPLDDTSVPDIGDFSVTVNGTAATVSTVAVHANAGEVVLTLAEPAYAGDTVVLTYTPGAALIQDFGNHIANALTDYTAQNASYTTGEAIVSDSSGNIYVAGYFEGAAKFGDHTIIADGYGDAYVAKRGADGLWQWAKSAGGPGWDAAYGLAVDANNVYLAGAFSGIGGFGGTKLIASGNSDIFAARLDQSGNWQWATRAGGTFTDAFNGGFMEIAQGVAVDGSGNVYIAGTFAGTATFGTSNLSAASAGGTDILIAKLDSTGAWQWAAHAGGAGNDAANGVAVDSSGIYTTGSSSANADFQRQSDTITLPNAGLFVAKLDADGVWQWADNGGTLGGTGRQVITDGSGNVYAAGSSAAITMNGYISQPFVGQWNATGNNLWLSTAATAGNGNHGIAAGLTLNADGYLYTTGYFLGQLNFGSIVLTAAGTLDGFVAKVNSADGAWQWAIAGREGAYNNANYVEGKAIASCDTGVVCATGNFANTATFGSWSLTTGSTQDMFIVKAGNTADVPPAGEWQSLFGSANTP